MRSQTEARSQFDLLSEAESQKVLMEWNATELDLPQVASFHELIERKASEHPEATAIICQNQQLTYSELNARANQLASYLCKMGVGAEMLVGICLERSLEMIIGLLGILKSGAAYLPLDPAYPSERVAFMLQDAQARALLTTNDVVPSLPAGGTRLIRLDTDWPLICSEPIEDLPRGVVSHHLAYVIYTSGSTGTPKGVMIEHGNVLNFFAAMDAVVPHRPGGTWLAVTSPSFDISVLELFWTLSRGFKVVLYPGDKATRTEDPKSNEENLNDFSITALIQTHGVTHLQCTPSMASMLLLDERARSALGCLETLLLGGEQFPLKLARQLREILKSTILNMYGPTETTVWSTTWQLPPDPVRILVGRPIANTHVYIADPTLRPVPVGAAGELLIGGNGVARGYLGREQLTNERFIPNPFPGTAGTRLYRTGDLARYLPDGNIELLGRIDHQIKIRGHRVELGEIEALLNDHPSVRECVVLFKELNNADKILVAYVIPRQGQAPTAQQLRQYAQEKLPEYMVPAQMMLMASFPQTPNKKIDRNAFPDPGMAAESSAAPENSRSPVTAVEDALAAIWKELLRAPQVGRDDKFFDLGGHSMLAMQLVSRVRKRFNVDLPLRNIFEHQTLGALAEVIEVLLWSALAKAPRQPIRRRQVVEV